VTEPKPFEIELTPRAGIPVMRRVVRGRVHGLGSSGSPKPFVLVTHGYLAFMDWGFIPALVASLVDRGLAVVTFNMSGAGVGHELDDFTDPQGFAHNTYGQELEDLGAVAQSIASGNLGALDPQRAGIFGHSRGAAMAVLHAASQPSAGAAPYRAISTWASVASVGRYDRHRIVEWRRQGYLWVTLADGRRLRLERDLLDEFESRPAALDVQAAAAQLDIPALLVHGARDRSVLPDEARALAEVYPPGRAQVETIQGVGHNFGARHPLGEVRAPLREALDLTSAHFLAHL